LKNEIKFINPEKISVAKNGSLLIWISKSVVISLHPNYLAKIFSNVENKKAAGE
jgi:hypothetical protein